MSSMNIRKGDLVLVTAGKSSDKGKKARVLETSPKNGTVIVEGINMQKHHKKPRSAKAAGGITEIAGPIDVSNVMLVCPNGDCPKSIHGARAKHILNEKGKSVRVCCKCGASLEPPKVDKTAKKEAKKAVAKKETSAKKEGTTAKVTRRKKKEETPAE